MGHQFILHIMLSLEKFETELDLTLHRTLRYALCSVKLIGDKIYPTSLQEYWDQLLKNFIEEHLVFFSIPYRVLDAYITNVAHLSDDVIVRNVDFPPVLQSNLLES